VAPFGHDPDLEHQAKVLGHCRARHREALGELGDPAFPEGQTFQKSPPQGEGDHPEGILDDGRSRSGHVPP
jgi:hypothetical protein